MNLIQSKLQKKKIDLTNNFVEQIQRPTCISATITCITVTSIILLHVNIIYPCSIFLSQRF